MFHTFPAWERSRRAYKKGCRREAHNLKTWSHKESAQKIHFPLWFIPPQRNWFASFEWSYAMCISYGSNATRTDFICSLNFLFYLSWIVPQTCTSGRVHAAQERLCTCVAQLNQAPKTKCVQWSMAATFIVTQSRIDSINDTIETFDSTRSLRSATISMAWRRAHVSRNKTFWVCIDDIVNCRMLGVRIHSRKMLPPTALRTHQKTIPPRCCSIAVLSVYRHGAKWLW